MTNTPEMPAMHPDGQERARRVRDADPVLGRDFSTKLAIDVAYRDGFTAGVLAERSRAPVDAAATRRAVLAEAEKAARGGDHSGCGHGEGYTDGRLDAAAAIAALADRTPVDAAAIRRATLEQAARLVRAHAQGEIKSISFGPEAKFDPEGVLEIVNQISRSRLGVLADRILALADHPPAQPVDDGWRSDMEAAPKNGARFLFTNGKDVVGTGRFFQGAHFAADSWQGSNYTVVTHWQPLPNLPAPPAPERET